MTTNRPSGFPPELFNLAHALDQLPALTLVGFAEPRESQPTWSVLFRLAPNEDGMGTLEYLAYIATYSRDVQLRPKSGIPDWRAIGESLYFALEAETEAATNDFAESIDGLRIGTGTPTKAELSP